LDLKKEIGELKNKWIDVDLKNKDKFSIYACYQCTIIKMSDLGNVTVTLPMSSINETTLLFAVTLTPPGTAYAEARAIYYNEKQNLCAWNGRGCKFSQDDMVKMVKLQVQY
jgi:hypothetical protein